MTEQPGHRDLLFLGAALLSVGLMVAMIPPLREVLVGPLAAMWEILVNGAMVSWESLA